MPAAELAWLADDLAAAAPRPAVIFTHQLLDGDEGAVFVRNAAEVRRVLETKGRVCGVFQGHHHAGGVRYRNGIGYYTLQALVEGSGPENSAYAVVEATGEGGLSVAGFHRAASRTWRPTASGGETGS